MEENNEEELKKLLKKNLELSTENNKMLKKLVAALRWSLVFNILKFLVVVGVAAGAYYFLQPIVEQAASFWGDTWDGTKEALPWISDND